MLLIWGSRGEHEVGGYHVVMTGCRICGDFGRLWVRTWRRFTFFFIPIPGLTWSHQEQLICSNCAN